ncbi:MAG: helix-turn-helix transcriptional regulator [Pseudobdellovibrio sp.]
MNDSIATISSIAREYRIRNQMTQLQLAEKLGYDSAQFVSLFERGVSKIPLETLGQLISILGIPEKKITSILVEAYQSDLKAKINRGKARVNG